MICEFTHHYNYAFSENFFLSFMKFNRHYIFDLEKTQLISNKFEQLS
nr:MAG TPA: hypothetical protein [Caudoviricetes sp.]